jgi:hypothetical protein
MPERLDVQYVLVSIMRFFPKYGCWELLKMPYAMVMKLFELSQKAEALARLDIFTGRAALNSEELMRSLVYVEQSATSPDKLKMKEVMSEENKLRAQKIAEECATKK